MSQKEKIKQIRDRLVPILVDQARIEMLNVYKAGMVEPLGEASVGILMSTEPIRSIQGPFIQRDFYACYKVLMPLRPLIPVSPSGRELLQEHVKSKIQASYGNLEKELGDRPTSEGGTLVIYWIDFWLTRDGEVWYEGAEGSWTRVLQLPQGLVQASYLNLKSTLHMKYVV